MPLAVAWVFRLIYSPFSSFSFFSFPLPTFCLCSVQKTPWGAWVLGSVCHLVLLPVVPICGGCAKLQTKSQFFSHMSQYILIRGGGGGHPIAHFGSHMGGGYFYSFSLSCCGGIIPKKYVMGALFITCPPS